MHEIATKLTRWLGDGERIALATVVWAEGSSPRPLGSRMAVAGSGQMAGSVSGGCVEGAVFEEAQGVLSGGPPKRLRYGAVDEMGWQVELACGGTLEVYLDRLAEVHRRLLEALEAEETVALATRLDGSAHLLAWPDGRMGGPAAAGLGGSYVCPSCGHRAPHVVGEPCYRKKCPKCGTQMVRE